MSDNATTNVYDMGYEQGKADGVPQGRREAADALCKNCLPGLIEPCQCMCGHKQAVLGGAPNIDALQASKERAMYHSMGDTMSEVFCRIDLAGGWPLDKPFFTMRHDVARHRLCYFSDRRISDEWNTTLYDEDDYHWWKLSGTAKKKIKEEHFYDFARQVRTLKPE